MVALHTIKVAWIMLGDDKALVASASPAWVSVAKIQLAFSHVSGSFLL